MNDKTSLVKSKRAFDPKGVELLGFEAFRNASGYVHLHYYALSQSCSFPQKASLKAHEFEKKLCRSAFKKQFGLKLPKSSTIRVTAGLFDREPQLKTSNYRQVSAKKGAPSLAYSSNKKEAFQSYFVCSGLQLMSASWALERIGASLAWRSSRAALNMFIRDVSSLMDQWGSTCPIKGVRVVATGRLGKQKKGMSQQIMVSTGKVPLSSLKEKIDYSQQFVKTSRGAVGLKLWLCYN